MTKPVAMNICPSEETLAAFIDGRLDPEARQRVIEHIVECAECRDIVMTAHEFQADEADEGTTAPARKVSRFSPRATFVASAALAAAAVLIVVFGPMVRERWENRDGDMQALVEASESLRHRPMQARLSGDFPYRNYFNPRGAGDEAAGQEHSDELALAAAHIEIRKRAEQSPTVANEHALGVSYLLLRKPDQARQTLEGALRKESGRADIQEAIRSSNDAGLLNDLAAAYQTLIEKRDRREFHPLAVEAVQRAWALENSPAIGFTRALVLESNEVRDVGIRAWEDYLALDPSSDWSVEASQRLKDLKEPTDAELWRGARERLLAMKPEASAARPLVDRFRQYVRLLCEDELLPQWGEAVSAGTEGADGMLHRIAALGEALQQSNGERDIVDAVNAIRAASADERLHSARGHAAYGRGRKAILDSAGVHGLREMEIAVSELAAGRTPFVRRASLERAAALHLNDDYEGALGALNALQLAEGSNVATARAEWIRGIASSQKGALEDAIGHYQGAADAFWQAGEDDHASMVHSLLASAMENAGRYSEADQNRSEALRLVAKTGDRKRYSYVVFEAAYAAIARDTPAVAELLIDSAVAKDIADREAFPACTSLMYRGAYRFRRGDRESARLDLAEARSHCGAIRDPRMRERAMANLGLAYAVLQPEQIGTAQLPDLDNAVTFFRNNKNGRWLRTAYVARGRALWASGTLEAAERDFQAALAEIRTIRREFDQKDARVSFTATADDITDAYVDFLLHTGRGEEAFELADGCRVREMVDAPGARWVDDSGTNVLPRVRESLPPDAVLVEYRIIGDRIVAWMVANGKLTTHAIPRRLSQIRPTIERLTADGSRENFRAAAADLHDSLLQPLGEAVEQAKTLIFVPDGDLERVPFAGLLDRSSSKYLVEKHASLVAPSARLFLQSAARWRRAQSGTGQMLVIEAAQSDARFDALPEATREARAIARLFPDVRIATGKIDQRALMAAHYVHFSGHTDFEAQTAMRMMRLGEGTYSPGGTGEPVAISATLVYLSSCQTDEGRDYRSEGALTLARSFFAAGVPVVVGSLRPVDDGVAREIAVDFYEQLRNGYGPDEALREAQLRQIAKGQRAQPDWAAFRIIGGGLGRNAMTRATRERETNA